MFKDVDDDTIKNFLLSQAANEKALINFGYLLLASDEQLNMEALKYIRNDLEKFNNKEVGKNEN